MRPSTREASVNTECFESVAEVNSVRRADGEQRFIALEAQHKVCNFFSRTQILMMWYQRNWVPNQLK